MNCPACGKKLAPKTVSGIEVELCSEGCLGIWFDAFELKKFDEKHEPDAEAMLALPSKHPAATNAKRNCPKCRDIVMLSRYSSVKRKVEIDECPKCAGFWLDLGELTALRAEFATDDERRKAAEDLADQMFGPKMKEQRAKSQDELEKARRVANAFKYICPSYYIPGKQKGGAF